MGATEGQSPAADPDFVGPDRPGQGELRQVLPLAYDELRSLAGHLLRMRVAGNPLRATSLVHETFLKLANRGDVPYHDRAHFLAVAARAMRWVLVDHARRKGASKRGAGNRGEPLADAGPPAKDEPQEDLLALHEALERLAAVDERKARVVEMRFFGGLTLDEIAQALDVSPATVKRDWTLARAWLFREVGGGGA